MGRVAKPASAAGINREPVARKAKARANDSLEALQARLAAALEQQAATGEILRLIRNSRSDLQNVFDTIVERVVRLCGAEHAFIFRFDGELLRPVASHGVTAGFDEYWRQNPLRPGPGSMSGRAALSRRTVHVADVLAEPGYEHLGAQKLQATRTLLAVPMLRDDTLVGVITTWKSKIEPFTDEQVELVETFADQAVIAIENVRLFNETKEALEQQTATSDILRVISSSPTDVQPVFDAIVQSGTRLCEAAFAAAFRYDGQAMRFVAHHNMTTAEVALMHSLYPRPAQPDAATGRAVLEGNVIHIADIREDPAYGLQALQQTLGFRTVLAVPMLRHGRAVGALALWRRAVEPFTDKQIALVRVFANQAVIAIDNVRLFTQLGERTEELSRSVDKLRALGEVGQAVSSTLDLDTVLTTIASRARQLAGMDGAAIHEYDESHEEFHLRTTENLPAELVDALEATAIRKGEGAIGKLATSDEPVQIHDITDAGSYRSRIREVILRCGYRSMLAVPLLREEHLLGALVVTRRSAGEFAPEVIDLLKTFAAQSALAIQNARLFREIEDKSRQLEIASQHKSEFLANMSHELRTPLNAIIGFSEVLAERMFGEINDKQAEYLGDILESGRHLLALINDILDLSKIEAGRMELELDELNLVTAIENTLTLVRERAHRRGIALERTLDSGLPKIRADERKVKQVLLNLLSNALKFTPEGGRIDVRAARRDGVVEVSVTDTGVGIAAADQATVFEEFRQVGSAAKKVEGTGLGLAISRKFIELHSGRIWVTSELGRGSTFAFTLPVQQRAPAPGPTAAR